MEIRRFSFVIHPLTIKEIHDHPLYRWTRYLPDALVESCAAFMPPIFISKVKGIVSPATGQQVEGYLYALSATPQQMLKHRPEFTYNRVIGAARMAAKKGAGIIGLGAFTSVVGDAGYTIAERSPIGVTSGNSLTAAAAIEAARMGLIKMGADDLSQRCVMVVGATGSIGSAVARVITQETNSLVLISRTMNKLEALKQKMLEQYPSANIRYGTNASEFLPECDVIISATSAFGQRVIDISQCKPGAVICDVARPQDLNEQEASLRPDVLVIDSGEVKLPGNVDIGYNIGLEPGVVFACMAETILLSLEGRFDHYTLGRDLEVEKVQEMLQLFKKHGFQLAPLRSFNRPVTDEEFTQKRKLADEMLADDTLRQRIVAEAAEKIATMTPMAKGVKQA